MVLPDQQLPTIWSQYNPSQFTAGSYTDPASTTTPPRGNSEATAVRRIQRKLVKRPPNNKTQQPTRPTTGRGTQAYNRLQDSPPPNLNFPPGNITIAEIAAFLPRAINSGNLVERYCNNGGSTAAFTAMINYYRSMEHGPIPSNTVLKMMQKGMNMRAKLEPNWENWNASTHSQFVKSDSFDPSSISVTGFRRPELGRTNNLASSIPFKNLAIGVKSFPTGSEALDLTRAVQYCVERPGEEWLFPDHYEELVNRLGPALVTNNHHDAVILAQFTTVQMAAGVRNAKLRKRDANGRLQKFDSDTKSKEKPDLKGNDGEGDLGGQAPAALGKKSKRKHDTSFEAADDEDLDLPSQNFSNKRKKLSPKPHFPQGTDDHITGAQFRRRWARAPIEDISDSTAEDELYRSPKKLKNKAAKHIRRSRRVTQSSQMFGNGVADEIFEEE
ncbi:hypothetical protein GQ44DRAFT_631459 [Phaeosphaeriaceae sp. PMI808]|nr:hypothetical protein GQ44DRAFT_631459 [Phaeosphaeriaceae sp. PMI808]